MRILSNNGKVTAALATIAGADGWNPVTDAWTYASATTITVPTGAAAKYAKGDRLKLTQTTVKYFYIVGVADTLLTITGGADYTLVSAAISAISVSHQLSPAGFPDSFTWTPGHTGFSANPATDANCRFCLRGAVADVWYGAAIGTSNATGFTITGLPVSAAVGQNRMPIAARGADNSADLLGPIGANIATTVLSPVPSPTVATWTATGTKGLYSFHISYGF